MPLTFCQGEVNYAAVKVMYDFNGVSSRPATLAVGHSALIVAVGFLAIRVHRGIGEFQLTHYYFNYSDEFLRRGLIGEVLRQIGFSLSHLNVALLYSSAVALFLLLLVLACARVFARLPAHIGSLFVVFMLACPGLTLHYAYSSYGYLDIFQLLLAASGLLAIYLSPLPLALAVAVTLAISSMLIHEAGLMITTPVLIAALMLKFGDRFALPKAALMFAGLVAVAILIWRHGSADTMTYEDHIGALTSAAGSTEAISDAAVIVLHRTLGDNIGLVLPRSPWWYAWQQVKFVIFAAPYLFFFVTSLMVVKAYLAPSGRSMAGLAMAAAIFAPVALYPIGHDYFRWWSAAMTNYFLLMLFFCSLYPGFLERLVALMQRYRRVMLTGIAIGVSMGGIGGLVSFSVHTAPAAMVFRAVF